MKEEIIKELPDVLRDKICTLKTASRDDTKREYMCDSSLQVINFDRVPNEYSKGKGWRGVPKSNDALYIDSSGKWYFIEFKNGAVKKDNIYRKLYDSLVMIYEMGLIPDFNFSRNNINYILVYNGEKQNRVQESASRTATYNYIYRLSQREEKLFGIEDFEGYLFCETHTYTKELFKEKFIDIKEQEEHLN